MIHRPGSRFGPSDLGAVRRYLRNMVERNESSDIKTMDVYEDVPWLLDHVSDPLFKKNLWYYFVPRTKRSRTVPGRGESEGGTWKSTGKKISIEDENKRLVGYKRSLVFNRKVNGNPEKTNWLMTEYSLHKDGGEYQDLVFVLIRYKKVKKDNLLGFNDAPRLDQEHGEVPQLEREDREVPRLERKDVALDNYINDLERMLIEEEDPQLEQQNTSNLALPPPLQINYNNDMMMMMSPLPPLPPSLQGQGFGIQTMQSNDNNVLVQNNGSDFLMQNNFVMQSNDNNVLMQSNLNNVLMQNNGDDSMWNHMDNFGFEGAEYVMLDIDQLLM